jgi:hypothetical protein
MEIQGESVVNKIANGYRPRIALRPLLLFRTVSPSAWLWSP